MTQVCFTLPNAEQYCITIPGPGGQGSGGFFSAQSTIAPSSNGGVFALSQVCLYPVLNIVTGLMEYRIFDVTIPPNDALNPSSYSWRVEQLASYRNPTVRKLFWTYTDLGQVTAAWTITGTNELGQQVPAQTQTVTVGNLQPTKATMTAEVDFSAFTAMNIQLSVTRAANAGPLSIIAIDLVVEVEDYNP